MLGKSYAQLDLSTVTELIKVVSVWFSFLKNTRRTNSFRLSFPLKGIAGNLRGCPYIFRPRIFILIPPIPKTVGRLEFSVWKYSYPRLSPCFYAISSCSDSFISLYELLD
ncbi:hypothetical protein NPIL_493151 [Nephila pilipes]|uniref:Uncharacterized protein n=1 Tax=Nephila pilipes TaxID=299642 RepID=A0A8X6PL42_NEPPI|nr:hypothetical protein NPIL_493151 [Nephila pilipes]